MFFPFVIKQKIIIDTAAISSEAYVFNHIIGYMDDQDMTLRDRTDKRLFFSKISPIRTTGREHMLKNISFTVTFPEDRMEVMMESETIVFFMTGCVIGLFFIAGPADVPLIYKWLAPLVMWSFGWLSKLVILNSMKHELMPILKQI